jgi:hypothetical protein
MLRWPYSGELSFDDIDVGSRKLGQLFQKVEDSFRSKKSNEESLYIIHPFSPILICEHHYGWTDKKSSFKTEYGWNASTFDYFVISEINVTTLKSYDVVCCQSDHVESFVKTILPQLLTPIILMTHKCSLPFIKQSEYTDALLNDSRIAHWFAHNPFFHPSSKLSAFPYGVDPKQLESYMGAIKLYKESSVAIKTTHNETRYEYPFKWSEPVIANLHYSVHHHISRQKLPLNKTRTKDYYAELAKYKYVISPHGQIAIVTGRLSAWV